jgi:hypothetical protein
MVTPIHFQESDANTNISRASIGDPSLHSKDSEAIVVTTTVPTELDGESAAFASHPLLLSRELTAFITTPLPLVQILPEPVVSDLDRVQLEEEIYARRFNPMQLISEPVFSSMTSVQLVNTLRDSSTAPTQVISESTVSALNPVKFSGESAGSTVLLLPIEQLHKSSGGNTWTSLIHLRLRHNTNR